MISVHFHTYALVAIFLVTTAIVPTNKKQTLTNPLLTIVTDPSWDVSGQKVHFGEYPLSAEQIASATSPLNGGTYKAVAAEYNDRSTIVPGSIPIWRNRTDDGEGAAYQFRKNVPLGNNPVQKATLEINCDDVGRVYINQRLASVEKRDGKLKDGWDDWFLFRSVSGFMYNRIYTYDVTDYFFSNFNNTILIEAVSLAFDGSHAYVSAKIVIEYAPTPEPPRPIAAAPTKRKPEVKSTSAKTMVGKEKPASTEVLAGKEKTIFEAGHDPEIEKLRVGSILELGHVYFKVNDYKLDSSSYRTLNALAKFMQRYPSLKIEVGGHTNLRPTDGFAIELSANRAQAVRRYLTDNGVAADRVTYKGYGKSQPRINALNKEADRANQRVEVKVLEK